MTASQNAYFGFLVARLRTSLDLYPGRPTCRPASTPSPRPTPTLHADTSRDLGRPDRLDGHHQGHASPPWPRPSRRSWRQPPIQNWTSPYGLAHSGRRRPGRAEAILDEFTEPSLDYFWLSTMQLAAELAVGLDRQDVARRVFDALSPHR